MIIDTHCHLYKEDYDDLDEVLNELKEKSIKVIVNGCSVKTNKEAIELANTYDFVYATVGFHPSEIEGINESDYEELEGQLNNNNVIGIGEIGLDYYWDEENKERQKEALERQLNIAKKYNKPVIIHNREATNDIYNILKNYNLKGIIHAFSGSIETARMFIGLGYKLGVGGVLTFKNSSLKDVIKKIDMEYIVLETDSPYLTPEPYRGKRNKPTYVTLVADKLAQIKGLSYSEICKETTVNVVHLFDLND